MCIFHSVFLVMLEKQPDMCCTSSCCEHLLHTGRGGVVWFYLSDCTDVALPAHAVVVGSSRRVVSFPGLDEIWRGY